MVFTHFRVGGVGKKRLKGIIAASPCVPNGQAQHGGCVPGPRCRCKQVTAATHLQSRNCGRSPKKCAGYGVPGGNRVLFMSEA